MSDEGEEDTEDAGEEEAPAAEEPIVVEEGQGTRKFHLCIISDLTETLLFLNY
jgi:hypothetical protein